MSPASLIALSRQACSEFWARRDARERSTLGLAALVVAFAIIYALLVDPALSARDRLNKSLPLLRQQFAQMQALSRQAAELSRSSAAPLPPVSSESIAEALARNGLKPQNVAVTGESVKVLLASSSFAAIMDWLGEMQKTARLVVVDADIMALPQPDMVNASITLRQPAHE